MLYLITAATMWANAWAMHKPLAALHRDLSMPSAPGGAWTHIPDVNVTFSSSFCCHERASLDNVLADLAAFRFCFTSVYLIIDVPHGGHHNRVHGSYPGGPGGHDEFLRSASGTQLLEDAQRTAQGAVALLQSHCPLTQHPLTWNVEVLNYDSSETRKALISDFGVNSSDFFFDTMYLNTMVYDKLLHLPDAQYVWHSDSGWRVFRVGEGAGPNFIEASITLMRSDMRVLSTVPTVTRKWSPVIAAGFQADTPEKRHDDMFQGWGVYKEWGWDAEDFNATWPQGEAPATTYSFMWLGTPFFSTEQFLMDVERAKTLLPFGETAQTVSFENFMWPTLKDHALKQVWFNESVNVICGHGSR